MNIYIILAHPEIKSFNTSLAVAQKQALESAGHKVRFKNLYNDHFNPLLTREDFPGKKNNEHIQFPNAQYEAYKNNSTIDDIAKEHNNLEWADSLILQFPLWLYGMPAILKGWCERVLSEGFAHKPANNYWFENGGLKNTRLLLSMTTNGRKETFSSRGRHGSLDIILWPILNSFWFAGFKIVKPFVAFDVARSTNSWRIKLIKQATIKALSIYQSPLLQVHSLEDYKKNGTLKKGIKALTAGQQKPDTLAKNKSG
jgi:NAD(P)H dehydrogenase (quinone)